MIKIILSLMLVLAVQSQTLQVGTDPSTPPFTYLQDGTNVGFDIDLFAAVAKVGGLQYEWVNLPWTDLFQAVLNETVDLADSGITINDARKLIYDFSVPYFLSTHVILAPADTDITKAQDLADLNKIVGVQNGTTGAAAVEKIFGGPSANIKNFTNTGEVLQALQDGTVDAVVHDSGILENFNNNNPGYTVIKDPNVFAKEFYGYMFPKGSTLVPEFNAAITSVLKSGEYSTIYETWFGSTPDVAILLAAGEDEDPYDVLNEEAVYGEEEGFIGEEEDWVAEAELYDDITLLI